MSKQPEVKWKKLKDENVLKFSVEYVGRYKRKDTEIEIEIEYIDTRELME